MFLKQSISFSSSAATSLSPNALAHDEVDINSCRSLHICKKIWCFYSFLLHFFFSPAQQPLGIFILAFVYFISVFNHLFDGIERFGFVWTLNYLFSRKKLASDFFLSLGVLFSIVVLSCNVLFVFVSCRIIHFYDNIINELLLSDKAYILVLFSVILSCICF